MKWNVQPPPLVSQLNGGILRLGVETFYVLAVDYVLGMLAEEAGRRSKDGSTCLSKLRVPNASQLPPRTSQLNAS